jgi:hypothetical protein
VWVVVLSNLIAILLQTLAARLGLVTGKHLAQVTLVGRFHVQQQQQQQGAPLRTGWHPHSMFRFVSVPGQLVDSTGVHQQWAAPHHLTLCTTQCMADCAHHIAHHTGLFCHCNTFLPPPQVCREAYPPVVCVLLWVLCEVSIVALDLTMVLGKWWTLANTDDGAVAVFDNLFIPHILPRPPKHHQ